MKVTVTKDFYDLKAFKGRRAGDVIEVPEDRGAELIRRKFAKPEKPENAIATSAAATRVKGNPRNARGGFAKNIR